MEQIPFSALIPSDILWRSRVHICSPEKVMVEKIIRWPLVRKMRRFEMSNFVILWYVAVRVSAIGFRPMVRIRIVYYRLSEECRKDIEPFRSSSLVQNNDRRGPIKERWVHYAQFGTVWNKLNVISDQLWITFKRTKTGFCSASLLVFQR